MTWYSLDELFERYNLMEQIFKLLENKTDQERAVIAAEILNDCEPNNKIMFIFLDELDDETREELCSRMEQYQNRE